MTKHYYTKGLDIPQDADSVRYFIPEGYTARLEDGVLIIEPKESEDEKIIKEIIHYLYTSEGLSTEEQTRWISYLGKQKEQTEELSTRLNGVMQEYVKSGKDEEEQEHRLKCYHLFWDALGDSEFFKQKEQKPVKCELEDAFKYYTDAGITISCGEIVAKPKEQKEQKLKWSKEDIERYLSCLQRLGTGNPDQPETINSKWFKEHCYPQPKPEWSEEDEKMVETICKEGDLKPSEKRWLKSLPERFGLQPQQEWSKIDEQISNGLIKVLENLSSDWLKLHGVIKSDTIAWLKCYHNRLSWKPNKEQMGFLNGLLSTYLTVGQKRQLKSLIGDLKKLI